MGFGRQALAERVRHQPYLLTQGVAKGARN